MADVKVRVGADASEFSRVMKGVRADINGVRNVIGGLVAASATIYGVTKAFQGLGAVLKDSSLEAAGIESLTMQFETLLGSADAAKKRMDEIAKFAANTPFEIKELAATSKLLQNLGGDMLATGDGLRMVGDAAAIAGQPLQEIALHVGRVFNAITSGTSAGESVNRLQEIGLLTGKAKRQFEELAAAQKKGTVPALQAADAMRLLQGQFAKTEGAMDRLASTTEGKLSNLADNISQLKVAFGTGMNDGIRIGLDAINEGLPKFHEMFTEAGKTFGAAIGEAVSGDTERLQRIGSLIGTIIGESAQLAAKTSFRGIGVKVLEGIDAGDNAIRSMLGLDELLGKSTLGARASEASKTLSSYDLQTAINQIKIAGAATQPSVMGYQAPTSEQLDAGREAVFRAAMERQTRVLESIDRKVTPQPFPN